LPESYKLKYIQASGGNQIIATATVVLERNGQQFRDSAVGDGPVDSSLRAIDRVTGLAGRLLEYTLHSVTRGKDAVGEVFMKVDFGKVSFIGKAASTDVIDASARAYLNAINKMLHYQAALAEHQSADSASAG
jgi:2-isopropylmalate synthase